MVEKIFTDFAKEKLLNGDFATQRMTGRVGIEIVRINSGGVYVKYFLEDEDSGKKLWETEEVLLKEGWCLHLEPVWMSIDVEIV